MLIDERRAGMTVLLLWGSQVTCLASKSVTTATYWGRFQGKGTAFVVKISISNVYVQSSPSSSPVHTIMTLLKWLPWLCKNAFCWFTYCLCQGHSLTSGHSWADILGCDLALCCASAGAPHLVRACSGRPAWFR